MEGEVDGYRVKHEKKKRSWSGNSLPELTQIIVPQHRADIVEREEKSQNSRQAVNISRVAILTPSVYLIDIAGKERARYEMRRAGG